MRRADFRAGFTLIEVLATLVITTAFVAVALPYAGRLVTHWWVGETAVEDADAWMQAIGRVSDDVAQAVPVPLDREGTAAVAFQSAPGFVEFVRPALGLPGDRHELESITYQIRQTSAGSALVRRSARFDPDNFGRGSEGSGTPATLLDGPFRLRMISIARDGTRRASWAVSDQMPAAVELSVAAAGRRSVPVPSVLMPIVSRVSPSLRGGAEPTGGGASRERTEGP